MESAHQLTDRQAEILGVLQEYVAENGRPPSRPELAKMLGIASTNGVFKHLEALARKGAIELVPRLYETMRQSPTDPPCLDVFQEMARAFAPEPGATAGAQSPQPAPR